MITQFIQDHNKHLRVSLREGVKNLLLADMSVNMLSKAYVLDHSGSFDMHIGKRRKQKNILAVSATVFAVRGGGGAQNVTDICATYRFFWTPSLTNKSNRCY